MLSALPLGLRNTKLEALGTIGIDDDGWVTCPDGWRDPFLPESTGPWSTYPALLDLFVYDGSGVMPGRTWVIAPDKRTLVDRWNALITAPPDRKEALFFPHQNGDRSTTKIIGDGLAGYPGNPIPVG